ncbi:MAG: tetratricopeptide repeat protein, partial [Candidatus Eremiobacterota bacterium]
MRKNFFLIIFYLFVTVTSVFGKSSDKLLEEAEILRKKGFPDSATAIYRQILESEPDNIQAITDFAEEMLEIRNYAYALTLYRRYLELKPDDVQVRTLVIDLYMSLELYDPGADECLNVLRKNPDDLIFLKKLKNIYQKANLLKKEMAVTEKISSLEPDNEEIKKRLLELYIMQGRYDKSVELVD